MPNIHMYTVSLWIAQKKTNLWFSNVQHVYRSRSQTDSMTNKGSLLQAYTSLKYSKAYTLPETNIAPENGWLEY